jgi:hypothetical protein
MATPGGALLGREDEDVLMMVAGYQLATRKT